MRSIQKVVIQRAEGMNGHYTMKRVIFIGDPAEEQGNQWLREIALTAPQNGSVKTNVQITFSNGDECEFRFDVQHISRHNNDTDIRQHVRSWLLYHCRPEELPHIAKDLRRLQYAHAQITPEIKSSAESLLNLLDKDAVSKEISL